MFFRLMIISVFVGLISGILSSGFMHFLNIFTDLRSEYNQLIWGLPFFGLFLAWTLKKIPGHINQGVPYILEELDNDKAKVSVWMVPFIFISSLGTHLFGGSAGREGVGVIMGASAAHVLPRFKKSFSEMRPSLIYSGIAAGFSSIFGTPLAAIVFAFELKDFKDIKKIDILVTTVLASFIALIIPHFFGPTHQVLQVSFKFDTSVLFYILIAGFSAGLGGQLFYWGLAHYTRLISYFFPHIKLKLFMGGLFICLLVFMTSSYDYIGIGTDYIGKAFISEMGLIDFIMKLVLTIMTLAIGFKGGEVTPLFFMGSTLSNSVASLLNLKNFGLSSSLGMVGLFGAVTGTPVASALMAGELFGWRVGVLAIVSCFLGRVLMMGRSVYRH